MCLEMQLRRSARRSLGGPVPGEESGHIVSSNGRQRGGVRTLGLMGYGNALRYA